MIDHDSMGSSLQLVGAQFSNFLIRKLSRESQNVDIIQSSNGHMSVLHEAIVTWSGTLVILQVCMLV